MTGTEKDSPLYAKVSQAHLDNFKRKILTADNDHILQGILRAIDIAVERQMITTDDRDSLQGFISDRRRAMVPSSA